jgi:pimeloyl-ACP methyl ester carboxylesterase
MKTLSLLLLISFLTTNALAQKTDTLKIKVDGLDLHAVLSQSEPVETSTIAIIIAGSGPTDLNGNQLGLRNNSLLFLSDALVDNGIATLRFDKRGIAKSAYSAFDEATLKVEDFAADVNSLIDYCREADYKNIYLIGHSEGSLIGLMAAQKAKIRGFISLCGPGNSADVVIKKQLRPKLPSAMFVQCEGIIDSLKQGKQVSNVPPQFYTLFRPSVQNYMISWFKYSPSELIATMDCPVLIVGGTKDIQVDEAEAQLLAKAKPQAQLVMIENMNHVLKTINGDLQENMASYINPELPLNQVLSEKVVEFINQTK